MDASTTGLWTLSHFKKKLGRSGRLFASQPLELPELINRLAWTGLALLTALSGALVIGWRSADFFIGERPIPVILGWGVLADAVHLFGHPMRLLQLSTAAATMGVLVAMITKGFRVARIWGRLASLLIGLAGAAAALPLLLIVAVLSFNLALWVLAAALCSLLLMLWMPVLFLRLLRR